MGKTRQAGFTLIELMVALAVMAIVLSFAIPSFESIVNSNRLSSAANEMVASIQTAKMESLRRNRRAVVCLSDAPNLTTPACSGLTSTTGGWITFVDENANGTFDNTATPPIPADTLLRTSLIKAPVQVLVSAQLPAGKLIVRSDGLARDNTGTALLSGSLDVCIPTRRPAENVRHVNIGFGSAVSIASENESAACNTPANYVP
ncbi:GspH/FimT family pseudopilin [Cognatiluteimonas profundi]|uniref:GspH/FimT family pseudopilin n=1 Tax=Cognatiluteimonas profundi TaxID=2594501 RepID=UPI00131EC754|nr:GspH/FimT family pseudopilin [Lysobacter profundi]